MTLLTHHPIDFRNLATRFTRGMAAWGVPEPMTLDAWARKHFYLSAESSYVEQRWTPWPFQRGIMACISNDDITEVDLKKSARVGYTKMLLAAIGYFAEHKRRNQALWQPIDDDAEDFVKSELDPMLRDVAAMKAVFPTYIARHRDNTLRQKKFLGSVLRVLGGKAAKNYRRISIDTAFLDELDAFDNDVEKEGDPPTLAAKRVEGATFPKLVCGSTPKLRGFSLIDERCIRADERFAYNIPCPHCHTLHPLTWGGKDEPHGLKWNPGQPETAYHLCPHCASPITQADYLLAADAGLWINTAGTVHLHHDGRFTDAAGATAPTPRHVAFHVWTIYSPAVAWSQIVREFLAANEKRMEGDDTKMKAFQNTTLGETWQGDIEETDADDLKNRAEHFPLRRMPLGCLLLLCGADTQDNRIELTVWGYGPGGQMWTIDHKIFFGNPALPELWSEVEDFVRGAQYEHTSGQPQRIYATAIDSGGHHADAVYAFAHRLKSIRVHAIKGSSGRERSIDNGNTRVSYKWNGKIEKHGPTLWHVGTNLAKDRFHSRLSITVPGPGYVHLSSELSDEQFKQLAGEVRAVRRTQNGTETRWTAARKRIEFKDCLTYAIWLEERLELWSPRRTRWWADLEQIVQPLDDLFDAGGEAPANDDARGTPPAPQVLRVPAQSQAPRVTPPQQQPRTPSPFASDDWKSRL